MVAGTTSTVFINEIHYDNALTDTGEFIEIANTEGTDLTGWSVVLYNGNGGGTYGTALTLSGTGQITSFALPVDGLQNGAPDGVALINASNQVVQFLSYEGSFTATGGAASGLTSTDIGVAETSTTTAGSSLHLTGTGTTYGDFVWSATTDDTPGVINADQSFEGAPLPILSINDVSLSEGNSGTVTATFTVSLNAAAGAGGVTFDIATADGTATAGSDYEARSLTSQTIAAGDETFTFTVTLNGDTDPEGDETYFVNVTNVTGATVGDGQGQGTITNDDAAPPSVNVFLSEIHYDNDGTDSGEFVEVTGDAGTDLTGWKIELYNGTGGALYDTITLSGSIDDEAGGLGALSFLRPGIQNGAPDGFALINASGTVVEFLSYEGSFAATSGTAAGLTSTDIGVAETSTTPAGQSLQKVAGVWTGPATASAGALNTVAPPPPPPPPPPPATKIYDIQGTGLTSALVGQSVITSGIVTAVDTNGFYLQDAVGDGNAATSDAIFVFTSSAPTVAVGHEVNVSGTVTEFTPGGINTRNQPLTEITSPTITVVSTGNALPAASVIDGSAIDGEDIAAGIAYFEARESMLVTVVDPLVVAGTNDFGEIFTVAGNGAFATGLSSRGTLNIDGPGGPGVLAETDIFGTADYNPERIQIQLDTGVLPGGTLPNVAVGAKLGDVTGVVSFNFGNYEVIATQQVTVEEESPLTREVSSLVGTADTLTIGSYNVLNLDPSDDAQKFTDIASDIVFNLNAPDIMSLEEVQDNDGATNSGTVSASVTLQMLVDAIVAAGGPQYTWIDNTFITDDENGGEPGGNIRVAFLYRDDRVDLVEGSVRTIDGDDQATNPENPFANSRLPLVATFEFNDANITVVTNHFSSKGGSTPIMGTVQPSLNGSADERLDQAQAVADFVAIEQTLVDGVVVLGDLNEFEFEDSLQPLYGVGLENLTFTLPEDERYSYVFQGSSQSLDHILATGSLADVAEFDAVHLNAEFAEVDQVSDHDPLLAAFTIGAPQTVRQNGGAGAQTLNGTNANRDIIDGGNGNDTIYGFGRNDVLNGERGNDTIYGGNGDDSLFGGNNSDTLYGEAGDDRISGDAGNDLLSGGTGLDTFVFLAKFGRDTITDFDAADDTIEFSTKEFSNFGEVQSAWSQDGDDVVINAGGGHVLRLQNVLLSELSQDDFLFI